MTAVLIIASCYDSYPNDSLGECGFGEYLIGICLRWG